MDLSATWLDFAGITNPSAAGMQAFTAVSLVKVLHGEEDSNREFVSSGLGRNASGAGDPRFDFRVVVQRTGVPTKGQPAGSMATFKYICCNGTCPGAPTNVPTYATGTMNELLYNVDADWQEMMPLNLSTSSPYSAIALALRLLLPPHFAAACAAIVPPTPLPPPIPSMPFKITHGGMVLSASSSALHAPVTLTAASSTEADVWRAAAGSGGNVGEFLLQTTNAEKLTIMIKHNAAAPCSDPANAVVLLGPNHSNSELLLTPAPDGGGGGYLLMAPMCPGLCIATNLVETSGKTLFLAECDSKNAVIFRLHTAAAATLHH